MNNQNIMSSDAMRNDTISDEQFRGFPRNSVCEKIRFRNKEDQKKYTARNTFIENKAHNDIQNINYSRT